MNLQVPSGASTTGLASTNIVFGYVNAIWVRPLQSISLLTRP